MALVFAATVAADGTLEDGASRAVVPWWSFTKALIAAPNSPPPITAMIM